MEGGENASEIGSKHGEHDIESCDKILNAEKSDVANDQKMVHDLGLSKNQLKRIHKKNKWLERRPEKRLNERAKAKKRRAIAKANNIDLGPSRKALKKSTMADSSCKLTVTIDLSFDDLMIDKDIAKLIKQILRCYTLNRRASAPMQFSLTSFNGKSKQEMAKHNGYEHWDVQFYAESYLARYPRDKIVYLTSESENVIENLEPECIYVIGGLVDHNSQKGHCHNLAVKEGIKHGRLPITKFLHMKARKVLTVDHVFEILLKVTEGKTWQEAFLQVLPERKNAQPVSKTTNSALDSLTDISKSDINETIELDKH
ncbi:tRNA methyltransferase 10 homolog A [Athalia rosae]|uniref:tRNA methyltransferase 10 homolog A n=1 Tax=Athalia rosae TaxID=37344 RepID=UPI002033A0F2|nr:tRNA methyltransferase 10 homolog A [Athalia rosae]